MLHCLQSSLLEKMHAGVVVEQYKAPPHMQISAPNYHGLPTFMRQQAFIALLDLAFLMPHSHHVHGDLTLMDSIMLMLTGKQQVHL